MLLTALIILAAYIALLIFAFASFVVGALADELDEHIRDQAANPDDPHPANVLSTPVHPSAYAEEAQRHHV